MRDISVRTPRRRSAVVFMALAIAWTALFLDMPPASAAVTTATPWTQMSTPHQSGSNPDDYLSSVSCPTVKFCMAVGRAVPNRFAANPIAIPLAEEWTGSWKVTPIPNPVPTSSYELTSVSCSSPSYCVALGFLSSVGSVASYSELWNGSKWTLTAQPISSSFGLASVSCFDTSCVAVGGSYTNGTDTTREAEWNGQSWTIDLTSVPGYLKSISCYAPDRCLAVGSGPYVQNAGTPLISDALDNGVWSDTAPPFGYVSGEQGVSCIASSQICTTLVNNGVIPDNTLVWSASSDAWSTGAPPQARSLLGLSCLTAAWCVAVGYYSTFNNGGTGTKTPTAAAWNGSAWTTMNMSKFAPNDVYPANPLYSVSCPSSTFCVAVGSRQLFNGIEPLAASWGGTGLTL
jgi:hypothetical protein